MNRIPAAVCFAVSLGLRIFLHSQGHPVELNLWSFIFEPLIIAWFAFLLPAMLPVMMIEDGIFHFAPWGDGHTATTMFYLTVVACLFWFSPVARVQRWFGVFNPFREGNRRLPSVARGAAVVLDTLHRLKIGKGKIGGWA